MVELPSSGHFLKQYQQVIVAANRLNIAEPTAVVAHYDAVNHLIVIRLNSGAVFSFSPDIAQGLAGASAENLAAVEITPSGGGLHWKDLDADFSVLGLLSGCFGTRAWMAQLQEQWAGQQAS